ncbi:PREDICTED: senescence-associated carboxylesterase 101 isoform X2 [Ipomoea nil]|uniref:senescence-associated carboxylesterase 101 isoform X2 n=1 Tax=Ipomoea nil TaxID=35883 RepID=UPI000901673A|nr:PREDICTED: senescence-associated carboxylesterase 101 isoform X2 [Ipomoea nil]
MNKFCCGEELASLVVSSDLLNLSWRAILDCYSSLADPGGPLSVVFKASPYEDAIFVAFVASPPASTLHHLQTQGGGGGGDFISSEELRSFLPGFPFDFICTKLNPSFRVHRAAIALFASIVEQLNLLKLQLCSATQTRLIITGHSLGGSVASLFTLWLLDSLSSKDKKHLLCITFGSPLVGDHSFQQAISERPSWNPCFLHVVHKHDPIPWSFICQQIHVNYKPFGIFLLCSESNCSCFEQPEATLMAMKAMSSEVAQSQYPSNNSVEINGQILRWIQPKTVRQGTSLPWNLSATPLQAGIAIQLGAIGVDMKNSNFNSLVTNIERNLASAFKRSAFDPSKKLNEMKKDMTFLEWYKKSMVGEGGYYDSFKNVQFQSGEKIISRQEIIKHKKILERYWKRMVEEAEKMPQKEGIAFRTRWLYAGTAYRRMVEPLDIAEYYRDGKKGYRHGGRVEKFKHYIQLEKWVNEDKLQGCSSKPRNKPVSLTEDSCFWGDVEEAVISCKVLGDGQSSIEEKTLSRDYLVRFEEYVMKLIHSYLVSSEIFLEGSTFRQWWVEYNKIIEPSCTSPLTLFMKNQEYRAYICDEYRAYV